MKLIFSDPARLSKLEGLGVVARGPHVYPSGVKETSGFVGRKQAWIYMQTTKLACKPWQLDWMIPCMDYGATDLVCFFNW